MHATGSVNRAPGPEAWPGSAGGPLADHRRSLPPTADSAPDQLTTSSTQKAWESWPGLAPVVQPASFTFMP